MSKPKKPDYDPIAQHKAMARATNGTPPPSATVPDKHKLKALRDEMPRDKKRWTSEPE